MIRVCHIVPMSFHEHLHAHGLGQFLMAMAPLVCASTRYGDVFREAKYRGAHVILDNGTPYIGESVPDDQLARAAALLRPDVLVLPDVLNDHDATRARIELFLTHYSDMVHASFMGVVQGRTRSDYLESYRRIAGDSRISHIGLPFMDVNTGIVPNDFERERFLQTLVNTQTVARSKPHHLLGLSHSGHLELQKIKKFDFVVSCDTSAAYKNAVLQATIAPNVEYVKPAIALDFEAPFTLDTATLTVRNARCIDRCAA